MLKLINTKKKYSKNEQRDKEPYYESETFN